MSKLDELIEEYCPQGVVFKPLGEVVKFINGRAYKQPELLNSGKYKVLRVGNFHTNDKWYYSDLELDEDKYCNDGDLLYTWAATLGPQIWHGDKVIFHYHIWKLVFDENVLDKRFLYHFLQMDIDTISKSLTQSTMPHVSMASMNKRTVPVPPMPVQREIVRILDNFTELTAELTTELTAELTARKKQYEYYRDALISNAALNGAGEVLLQDISEFVTVGIANSATHAYSDSGTIMFRNQNIKVNHLDDSDLIYITPEFAKKYQKKSLKSNDILVTRTGYPGQACLVPERYEGSQTFTTLIVRLKETESICPMYICYFINSGLGKSYVDKMKSGAAQQNFGAKSLEKMPILLPSIERQNKIVSILERFESLYKDISTGLPAEIEARQKQYEYYRDKLLTFKQLS